MQMCTCAHSCSILRNNKLPAERKFEPVNGPQTGRPMWRRLIGNSVQTPHNHAQPLVLISHSFAPLGCSPCPYTCCHSNILCGCTDIPTVWSVLVAWMPNKFRSLITSVRFYQTARQNTCKIAFWIRLARHVARVAIGETGTDLFLGTNERKRLLGRPRRGWKYDV